MSDENSDNTQRKKKGIMDRMKEIANSMFGIGDNLSANTNTNSDDHSSQHHHAQDETSTGNHKNSMIVNVPFGVYKTTFLCYIKLITKIKLC